MMAPNKLPLLINIFILLSCGGTTNNLSSGEFSKTVTYKVNSYEGCCGCFARYFNIYRHRKNQEQIIYDYNCPSKGLPTKFIFNYNKNGRLVNCVKFIATTSNDFEVDLTDYERIMFSILDSDTIFKFGTKEMEYSAIKGFRKPIEKESTHNFPLIKKGYKMTVK